MKSWLRCLNYIHNVIAHHSRLWNRNLIDQPKLPKKGEISAFDILISKPHTTSRVYVIMCILAHFMKHTYPKSSWQKRLIALIQSFPNTNHFNMHDMGLPKKLGTTSIFAKQKLSILF